MKINRYVNFINEEVPYNFEVGANISNRPINEWTSNELEDLKNLGADEISKNVAVFKQEGFNITIQKDDKSPFYIATSNIPLNLKNTKIDNYISADLWGIFLKKLNRFVKNGDNSIEILLNKLKIKNYHISDDGTVDVNGDVILYKKIAPLNFGYVSGKFIIRDDSSRNLIGCPKRVGSNFIFHMSKLTSLEGCPTYIGGGFECWRGCENLWSMDHFPRHAKEVYLGGSPIEAVFKLFRDAYLKDGGVFFSTSGTMMDFFWDCDPVYPGGVIKKRRLENFLASIGKKLTTYGIRNLKEMGWKIES